MSIWSDKVVLAFGMGIVFSHCDKPILLPFSFIVITFPMAFHKVYMPQNTTYIQPHHNKVCLGKLIVESSNNQLITHTQKRILASPRFEHLVCVYIAS